MAEIKEALSEETTECTSTSMTNQNMDTKIMNDDDDDNSEPCAPEESLIHSCNTINPISINELKKKRQTASENSYTTETQSQSQTQSQSNYNDTNTSISSNKSPMRVGTGASYTVAGGIRNNGTPKSINSRTFTNNTIKVLNIYIIKLHIYIVYICCVC